MTRCPWSSTCHGSKLVTSRGRLTAELGGHRLQLLGSPHAPAALDRADELPGRLPVELRARLEGVLLELLAAPVDRGADRQSVGVLLEVVRVRLHVFPQYREVVVIAQQVRQAMG